MRLVEVPGAIVHGTWETGRWMHGHPKASILGATALCGLVSFGGFNAAGHQSDAMDAALNQLPAATQLVTTNQAEAHQLAIRVKRDERDDKLEQEVYDQAREIKDLTAATDEQDTVNYYEDQARRSATSREDDVILGVSTAAASGVGGTISFFQFFIWWADRDYRHLNQNRGQ